MVLQIEEDLNRFKNIIKGKIKENLRKYISHGEMIGKRGRDVVSIPIPQIRLPRFEYGDPNETGVGIGEGKDGQDAGEGGGKAGDQPGTHIKEVEISITELAEILGDELELPRIDPKGKSKLVAERTKYSMIRRTGPETLRHFKRTFKEALKRQISAQEFNLEKPIVIPIKEDLRYRSWKTEQKPETNAVIFYMMDVSGSMGEEQKEIVRIESFWIDTWLRAHYPGLDTRYIIHDAVASEVDRETFFTTKESGGTVISTAYELCAKIIKQEYPVEDWNIYPFHFSDGDNWSKNDNERCFEILENDVFPVANMFCYGQVESVYGSGQFIEALESKFENSDMMITSVIPDREGIYASIKKFLEKGR